MITIPVEDLVFVVCTLVGGGLLLITVLLDDVLGGLFDALHIGFDIGGTSLMPLALSFIAMFGVGGLFATQILDIHGGAAAVVGAIFGTVAALIAYLLFTTLRKSEAADPFSTADLVGHDAIVAVSIPAHRWGSVYIHMEGQTHEVSATSDTDIASGYAVRVASVAGLGVTVAPVAAPTPTVPGTAPAASTPETPQTPASEPPATPAPETPPAP